MHAFMLWDGGMGGNEKENFAGWGQDLTQGVNFVIMGFKASGREGVWLSVGKWEESGSQVSQLLR